LTTLSSESFRFMAELQQNNNKPWFDANRERYEEHVRKPLKALAETLAGPVAALLPEFSGRAKVSRINNDIRFSKGKPLYKQHMWISFGGVATDGCADLFVGISGAGWSAGAGIGAPKREPLDGWRENLIVHAKVWKKYSTAMEKARGLMAYTENSYTRPLHPDAPAELQPLLQAREVWLVENPRLDFDGDPAHELYKGICRMLPAYLFMALPSAMLRERLGDLPERAQAPDGSVVKVWKAVR
jgi:uncharacterized protein (TIGR02453 family)